MLPTVRRAIRVRPKDGVRPVPHDVRVGNRVLTRFAKRCRDAQAARGAVVLSCGRFGRDPTACPARAV